MRSHCNRKDATLGNEILEFGLKIGKIVDVQLTDVSGLEARCLNPEKFAHAKMDQLEVRLKPIVNFSIVQKMTKFFYDKIYDEFL